MSLYYLFVLFQRGEVVNFVPPFKFSQIKIKALDLLFCQVKTVSFKDIFYELSRYLISSAIFCGSCLLVV